MAGAGKACASCSLNSRPEGYAVVALSEEKDLTHLWKAREIRCYGRYVNGSRVVDLISSMANMEVTSLSSTLAISRL